MNSYTKPETQKVVIQETIIKGSEEALRSLTSSPLPSDQPRADLLSDIGVGPSASPSPSAPPSTDDTSAHKDE